MEEKIQKLHSLFQNCTTKEATYSKIIELGRLLPPLADIYKTPFYQVPGCQSIVHLHAYKEKDNIYFEGSSNSLISAGLLYILILIYNGKPLKEILILQPKLLNDLKIYSSLSMNRANGLSQIILKIKQKSLELI